MLRKPKLVISLLAALALGLMAIPNGIAFAVCNRTGGSGSNDVYTCTNPPDTDGVSTGSGDDRIVINPDTTVSGGGTTVDAGSGSDYVENRGTITARYDGINMRDGVNDVVVNYGTINASDDGIWCTPRSGQTCTIRNYGTLTTVNESLDISSSSGRTVIYNQGRIVGGQETMHFHGSGIYEVDNRGYIESKRSVVEVYPGTVKLTNSGTMVSTRSGQIPVLLYTGPDTLYNTGTIRSLVHYAIYMHGGNDVLHNFGNIESKSGSSSYAAVMMGPGSDTMVTGGNILEMGSGYAAIAMNDGNDRLTIRGGRIQGRIYGNGGSDTLIFEFTGTSSEINTFRSQMAGKSPSGGSVTFRGNTYEWRQFESIQLVTTVASAPSQPVLGVFEQWFFGYYAMFQ